MDKFRNINSESVWQWIFRKEDNLDQIVFVFLSKLNAQNARYFQLFEASESIRIVYFVGLRIRYTDRISLKLFSLLTQSLKKKIMNYKTVHFFSIPNYKSNQKQILHIDDPLYSAPELRKILKWERNLTLKKGVPVLICTNSYTKNWFKNKLIYSKIYVIEQGFQEIKIDKKQVNSNFSCVYTSPYIHINKDKHGQHSTWGAELLINEIIPRLSRTHPSIEVHLVGELGKQARFELSKYENVFVHGRVGFYENAKILSNCSIGIYPRAFDHKRSILKIFSYIGAGLPVVTFDLIDTRVIKDFNLGLTVNNIDDFICAIVKLRDNPDILEKYKTNIVKFRPEYSWKNLSKKMNQLIN